MNALPQNALEDRYELTSGRLLISGIQMLARLPLVQSRLDKAAGLNTNGYISGYRGSPLGGYDQELWRQGKRLSQAGIVFQAGVNEDLAATAVWGSQQVGIFPGARVQGVFGLWYGKTPGVDRSGDVLKHANAAGTSPYGGVLAICGDDHECKSSSIPGQSEYALIAAEIPILSPSTIAEIQEFGLAGIAMSRFSGCWSALIVNPELLDSLATVEIADPAPFVYPDRDDAPWGGPHIRVHDTPIEQERRLRGLKLPSVMAFARANKLNRISVNAPDARIGILAGGKAYAMLLDALSALNLAEPDLGRLGVRIGKVGMPWPLDGMFAANFAQGLERVLVLEDKRAVIEPQLKEALYGLAGHQPQILGKKNGNGEFSLPDTGALTISDIVRALKDFMPDIAAPAAAFLTVATQPSAKILTLRTPFYCSGCPHNRSTVVPEGMRAIAGIGCHYMVQWMDRSSDTFTQMGGEGVTWLGQAPFTDEKHVFVNLGDGTYTHSGILAIRAAVAAKATITYKLLYNNAVAMTGGQPTEGAFTPLQMVRQLLAEGVAEVAIVAENPENYPSDTASSIVSLHPRQDLDQVQKKLAAQSGVTVLLYDQTCAAEKRRLRKRGKMPDAPRRAFINEMVCEGCGDCSVKSNCISITPVDTEFGRKRRIDQSSCNKDLSCIEGFCPSFVTVEGDFLRKPQADWLDEAAAALPLPKPAAAPVNLVIAGTGGTGVTTCAAVLAMAAHLEGTACIILDMTGLAQKGGAVLSHVRFGGSVMPALGRVPEGSADVILAADLLVGAAPETLKYLATGRTRAICNHDVTPIAEMVRDGDTRPDMAGATSALRQKASIDLMFDATAIAEEFLGDSIYTNFIFIGAALQLGYLPISLEALTRAIGINGASVTANLRAITLGRLAARGELKRSDTTSAPVGEQSLAAIIAKRWSFLTAYQNRLYAERYNATVRLGEAVDRRLGKADGAFSRAVAEGLFKLMAYKDEYEVARLYGTQEFHQSLHRTFSGKPKLQFHLSPPLIAPKDPETGLPRKMVFGAWILPVFKVLAKFRFLRGTAFDPIGWLPERRMERALIREYEDMVAGMVGQLDSAHYDVAVALAALPQDIRGYGHVKMKNIRLAEERRVELYKQLAAVHDTRQAAE